MVLQSYDIFSLFVSKYFRFSLGQDLLHYVVFDDCFRLKEPLPDS